MNNGVGRRILLLQHARWEVPGVYGEQLGLGGWTVVSCRPDLGERMPDWTQFDGILAMGGPMSANDHVCLPWLSDEIALVATAVRAGVPFFGVCLGAQILAAGLGARVYPGPRPEFGMRRVRMTDESLDDPLFGGVPQELPVFQWHGETFDLPAGAVLLATGRRVRHQAIRVGRVAYGVQFHMEVSTALLTEWLAVPSCRQEIVDAHGPDRPAALLTDLRAAEAQMLRHATDVFGGWLDLVAWQQRLQLRTGPSMA
jgi:GMP synthase (glutamine-hydrolysing)